VFLTVALLLSACAADPARLAAADDQACAGYGFTPGTDAYANCRMRLQMQRGDHQEARRRDILNSIPEAPIR
jgi:GTP cyclohydrolase III